MAQARDILDLALATAMHAMRTNVATTLGSIPGTLTFSRGVIGISGQPLKAQKSDMSTFQR